MAYITCSRKRYEELEREGRLRPGYDYLVLPDDFPLPGEGDVSRLGRPHADVVCSRSEYGQMIEKGPTGAGTYRFHYLVRPDAPNLEAALRALGDSFRGLAREMNDLADMFRDSPRSGSPQGEAPGDRKAGKGVE